MFSFVGRVDDNSFAWSMFDKRYIKYIYKAELEEN